MKILITGAGGFIGRRLCKVLTKLYPGDVTGLVKSENELQALKRFNDGKIEFAYGDVRDEETMKPLLNTDVVVHLAALKHVDVCEKQPYEAVMVNIDGTLNLLKYFKGKRFVYMSTDKAVYPLGVYGATKLLGEKLVLGWNGGFTKAVVRAGNVFGSDGSVIDYWCEQVKKENRMDITEPDMTRYFIGVDDLCWFLTAIIGRSDTGLFIPVMKATTVGNLCRVMNEILADGKAEARLVGMRNGEKWHEQLYLPNDRCMATETPMASDEAEKATDDDIKDWWLQAND